MKSLFATIPALARYRAVPFALFLLGFAASASAATIGFSGSMGGAALGFENTSTSATITRVHITIGDTAYNFDAINLPTGNLPTLLSPDAANDGVRADFTDVTFTSFDPGDDQNFPWDIDPDTGNSGCCRVSGVLFNNGAAPNAVLTIDFSTGDQVAFTLQDTQAEPDDPGLGPACPTSLSCPFSFSRTLDDQSSAVPAPYAWVLLAAGGSALAASRLAFGVTGRRRLLHAARALMASR